MYWAYDVLTEELVHAADEEQAVRWAKSTSRIVFESDSVGSFRNYTVKSKQVATFKERAYCECGEELTSLWGKSNAAGVVFTHQCSNGHFTDIAGQAYPTVVQREIQ